MSKPYFYRDGPIVDSAPRRLEYEIAEFCEPVTRAQLRALRTASALKTECHYIITDYNRGTVGAAEILLHAVNENTLSMTAMVNTVHDNLSWRGIYDIDTNRIEALHDNLGNDVYGRDAVDFFPWGVANVNRNEVRDSRLNYTDGVVTENTIISNSTVTVRAGTLAQNTIEHSSNVTLSGGIFQDNTVSNDSNVTVTNGSNLENSFKDSSTYNQVGTGYIRYSSISGNSTITNGNTNISNSDFSGATTFNSTNSNGSVSNSTFGYESIAVSNIPSLTLTQSTITSGSSIGATGATRLYVYRSSASAGGRYLVSAGRSLDCSYCSADNYSYFQVTQGIMNVTYSSVDSYGYISHQSTGTNRVDRCNVSAQSNIRFLNSSTGGRMYYCNTSSGATLYHSGTSNNCYFYYVDASSLAQVYAQNSVDVRFYYCSASSYGYIRAYGTNTGQSIMYYVDVRARGYAEHLNITARNRYYSVSVEGQSIARQTGGAAAANLYYSTFHAYYYFLVALSGVTRSGLHGYGRQSYTGTPASNGAGTRNWT